MSYFYVYDLDRGWEKPYTSFHDAFRAAHDQLEGFREVAWCDGWHEDMGMISVYASRLLIPEDPDSDWVYENSVCVVRCEQVNVVWRPDDPEPPVHLLAPWRVWQLNAWLEEWWDENWGYNPDFDHACGYELRRVMTRPDIYPSPTLVAVAA